MFGNIKVRLTLWYILITALVIAFFGVTAYLLLRDSITGQAVAPWDIRVAQSEQLPDGALRVTGFTSISERLGLPENSSIVTARAFTKSDLSESSSENVIIEDPSGGAPVLIERSLLANPQLSDDAYIWLYIFLPKNDPGNRQVLVVYQSTRSAIFALGSFTKKVSIIALSTLALAALLGFFLVSRMLRPVRQITQAAREIEGKNLGRRLIVRGSDELAQLASTLNSMFERLELAFERERQFTSDVAHELRTPLTIAEGEATLALRKERNQEEYKKALETISREISRLSLVINKLLFLTRSESTEGLTLTAMDLTGLLVESVADAEVLCSQKNISIQFLGTGSVTVRGDQILLHELFINLLDNAVRYTPPQGTITVSAVEKDHWAVVSVRDTGIGIPREQISNIFNRFYRVDKSRAKGQGGEGLGLAICKRIVELHKGRIEVESEVGAGSVFSIYLPLP